LLERALSLSVEEQEALANSLISKLGGEVEEGVHVRFIASPSAGKFLLRPTWIQPVIPELAVLFYADRRVRLNLADTGLLLCC
jgi:hypothetical protein